MNYFCLKESLVIEPPYSLVSIRREDMQQIRQWRNDQIEILRQNTHLTSEDQENYWNQVLEPSFKEQYPKQVLFSFLHAGKCIGYGGLTHIEWNARNAEVSFLLQTERQRHSQIYRKDFIHFLALLKKAAFDGLDLHRLYTETFDIRPHHIAVLEKFGFQREGCLKEHVKVEEKYVDSIIHGYIRHA